MSLRIGYRVDTLDPRAPDKTARIVIDGEELSFSDYFTGARHLLVVMSREEDSAGIVFELDTAQANLYESGKGGFLNSELLTDDRRIAVIPPGEIWGMQVTAESRDVGHLIIEALDFGQIGDVLK